jgi:hypothetical protein
LSIVISIPSVENLSLSIKTRQEKIDLSPRG